MKAITTLIITCFFTVFAQSQINSVTVVPSNPHLGDTVTAYIDLTFGYSACDLEMDDIQIVDSTVYANVYHCPGMLAAICNITDTVKFVVDSAWNYQLQVGVFVGGGTTPCNYPAGPSDTDLSNINVTDTSGTVGIRDYELASFNVFPNPSSGQIQISTEEPFEFVEVYSYSGRLLEKQTLRKTIDLDLPNGMYLIRLTQKDNASAFRKVVLFK